MGRTIKPLDMSKFPQHMNELVQTYNKFAFGKKNVLLTEDPCRDCEYNYKNKKPENILSVLEREIEDDLYRTKKLLKIDKVFSIHVLTILFSAFVGSLALTVADRFLHLGFGLLPSTIATLMLLGYSLYMLSEEMEGIKAMRDEIKMLEEAKKEVNNAYESLGVKK
ncbi:MAG: hypothetical protein QXD51_03800 [Candidatus Anstonellales archaeon]